MKTITVYRVQHAVTEAGPYRCEGEHPRPDLAAALNFEHSFSRAEEHPTPRSDGIEFDGRDTAICGFKSLSQLHEWFDGWQHRLDAANFNIGVYQSSPASSEPYCVHGGHQLVFDSFEFDMVDTLSLLDTMPSVY